jgi:hypothetical protein
LSIEEKLRESYRLALVGSEAAIAQDVTTRLADSWLGGLAFPRGPRLLPADFTARPSRGRVHASGSDHGYAQRHTERG